MTTFTINDGDEEAQFLTTTQARQILGQVVTERTIVNWIKQGRIAATRVPTKRGRYLIYRDLFLADLGKLRLEHHLPGKRIGDTPGTSGDPTPGT